MSDNENPKASNELKYSGLAALIIEGQHQQEVRHNDFIKVVNHRFDKLDNYNTYQNGHVGEAMKQIAELEKESANRKLTCQAAVAELKTRTNYTKFMAWANNNQKKAAALSLAFIIGAQSLVLRAYEQGWLSKIWEFLKDIT